jgi:hypothetical protein
MHSRSLQRNRGAERSRAGVDRNLTPLLIGGLPAFLNLGGHPAIVVIPQFERADCGPA